MPRFIPLTPYFDHAALQGIAENWARKSGKLSEIFAAYAQRGGWEGWLQVELTREFGAYFEQLQQYGVDTEALIEREAHIFANQKLQVDILLMIFMYIPKHERSLLSNSWSEVLWDDDLRDLPSRNVVIELKCESSRNNQQFKSGVRDDLAKIRRPFETGICGGTTAPLILLMAISITEEGKQAMEQIEAETEQHGLDVRKIYLGREGFLYLLYCWVFEWATHNHTEHREPSADTAENIAWFSDDSRSAFARNTAAEWVQDYKNQQRKNLLTTTALEQYYVWHHLNGSLTEVTDIYHPGRREAKGGLHVGDLRVSNDIMEAVHLQELPFKEERMGELQETQKVGLTWDRI